MRAQFLEIEEHGRVAVVRIARPEKKNALCLALIQELTRTAQDLSSRADIGAVVLTGQGPFFSAGMDLTDSFIADFPRATLAEKRVLMSHAPRMCQAWENMGQITLAAIEGFCLGGGLSLASSLDFRVMAQSAYICAPEIDWGMNMSWGTLPRLLHLVGPARAKQIIVLAEKITAAQAYEWGWAQWVCPDGKALETAENIAQKAAGKPLAPVSMTKRTVNALATAMDALASHMDADQFLLSVMDSDFASKLSGFFNK